MGLVDVLLLALQSLPQLATGQSWLDLNTAEKHSENEIPKFQIQEFCVHKTHLRIRRTPCSQVFKMMYRP